MAQQSQALIYQQQVMEANTAVCKALGINLNENVTAVNVRLRSDAFPEVVIRRYRTDLTTEQLTDRFELRPITPAQAQPPQA